MRSIDGSRRRRAAHRRSTPMIWPTTSCQASCRHSPHLSLLSPRRLSIPRNDAAHPANIVRRQRISRTHTSLVGGGPGGVAPRGARPARHRPDGIPLPRLAGPANANGGHDSLRSICRGRTWRWAIDGIRSSPCHDSVFRRPDSAPNGPRPRSRPRRRRRCGRSTYSARFVWPKYRIGLPPQ